MVGDKLERGKFTKCCLVLITLVLLVTSI